MFAGKKSAQIREILISESAWEEMTCLFAPSLGLFIAWSLNEVDKKYELSDKLIACIREGLKERQRIEEWNAQRLGYRNSLYGGIY